MESDWIIRALSEARFRPYVSRAAGDRARALNLYWWNVEASGAFYPALHLLEVALRNAIHARLVVMLRSTDWWRGAGLQENGLRLVADAAGKVRARKPTINSDDVVAELTFGFWISLLSKKYDQSLWVPGLYKAFPYYRGSRRILHQQLHTIMLFRNRIMHHEPIHHRHLEADHAAILRALGYLSPHLVSGIASHDHARAVLRRRPSLSPQALP